VVFDEFFFRPLNLKHTWLVGRSEPQVKPSAAPADVFSGNANITKMRSNGAFWADGGIVSTPEDMVAFLKALNQGKIISKGSLELMHHWRPLTNSGMPFQYGFGTMKLAPLPSSLNARVLPTLWGHSGSIGSFLYYAPDLDLYMAGTIDQTDAGIDPFLLMLRVMTAVRQLK
jgi:D-alanyl-D-alanine carboxypeptidase